MTSSPVRAYVIDLAERAARAFIAGATPVIAGAFATSGVGVLHATDLSVLEKVAMSATAGGGAAVVSLLLSVLAGLKTGTASMSKTVATSTPDARAVSVAADILDARALPNLALGGVLSSGAATNGSSGT